MHFLEKQDIQWEKCRWVLLYHNAAVFSLAVQVLKYFFSYWNESGMKCNTNLIQLCNDTLISHVTFVHPKQNQFQRLSWKITQNQQLSWHIELCALLSVCLCVCRWSLNGTLINLSTDSRRRLSGGNLVIRSLDRAQDGGIYQCTAFNPQGAIPSRRSSLQFACESSTVR